ncbi:hypothetical protein GCM10025859_63370 [Alicyclobacillus fastidiosus]|nr:hypothetical protein GCM10025859_62640 [Alicyclobacillus fastidiosus]GMA65896.1 hypothetical protein GCM10025859_63370 [Alicyclobacillus fastidiosus]
MPSFSDEHVGGGLFEIESLGGIRASELTTAEFTFPVIFDSKTLGVFSNLLKQLSEKWHLNLWPIYRLCKAVNKEYVEMDSFLQLIFAFEGVFDKNASSDFMKLAVQILLASSRKEANEYRETLDRAFNMRNDCVHGSMSFSGMESVRIGNRNVLSQGVFWPLKRIASGMILVAFKKLIANPNMKNLRIVADDVLDKIFTSRS